VGISTIEVLEITTDRFRCRVRCSKGTYIRVLAEDLGNALGCGAHLAALTREATGTFELKEAVGLVDFEAMSQEDRLGCLLPEDSFVRHLPILALSEAQAARICHGQAVDGVAGALAGQCRLYLGQRFLGLGKADERGVLTAQRLLAT
jgi:tRNA pseudouridine55 synthase